MMRCDLIVDGDQIDEDFLDVGENFSSDMVAQSREVAAVNSLQYLLS